MHAKWGHHAFLANQITIFVRIYGTNLKRRVLGLAVIERARKKQASRVMNLKLADANSKFFHRRINDRRRKNHIQGLKKGHGRAFEHEDKEKVIRDHFAAVMGRPIERTLDLNWDNLDQPALDLHSLDDPISEDEIKTAIFQILADKALGPDGYTSAFFRACWDVIKGDFMEAVIAFHNLRISSLPLLNSANIVLIPMKEGIDYVTDHRRPISLIHSFAKIIAKALA